MTAGSDPSDDAPLVELAAIEEARRKLEGVIRSTRLEWSGTFSSLAGRPVALKHEEFQRTGSFKLRGAYTRIAQLPPEALERGVVAASAGNHAQGVALAATLLGTRATVFMPVSAAFPKVDATRRYGADVRLEGSAVDDALAAAQAYSLDSGATFIAPFDDPAVIAGQGTLGLEILEQAPETETIVVPVGGGGLIAGVAAAVKQRRPGVRVVGVEAAGAAAMASALVTGEPVRLGELDTMADGIAVRSVSALTLAHAQAYVDDVVTVTEEQISQALLLLLERSKAVVEPAAATALAAVLGGKVGGRAHHGPVCAVLSGGNVDPLVLVKVVEHGLAAAGRYMVVQVVLTDRPGELAHLLGLLAELGLNVIAVDHQRAGVDLAVDEVDVRLTLETRDPDHRDEVLARVRAEGYRIRGS